MDGNEENPLVVKKSCQDQTMRKLTGVMPFNSFHSEFLTRLSLKGMPPSKQQSLTFSPCAMEWLKYVMVILLSLPFEAILSAIIAQSRCYGRLRAFVPLYGNRCWKQQSRRVVVEGEQNRRRRRDDICRVGSLLYVAC